MRRPELWGALLVALAAPACGVEDLWIAVPADAGAADVAIDVPTVDGDASMEAADAPDAPDADAGDADADAPDSDAGDADAADAAACDAGGPPIVGAVSPTGALGCPGESVTFSATTCGTASSWSWSFGLGTEPGVASSAAPTVTLRAPGTWSASVSASGDGGAPSTLPFSFTVATPSSPTVQSHQVLASTLSGFSIQMVGGAPASAVRDLAGAHVAFVRATSAAPAQTSDWTTHEIDSGAYSSGSGFAVIHDAVSGLALPAASYYDRASNELRFAQAKVEVPTANADWTRHTVRTGGGLEAHMVELGGMPAIASFDPGGALWFSRATTATPTSASDWVSFVVDTQGPLSPDEQAMALSVVGGAPVLAYLDTAGTFGVRVAVASSPTPGATADFTRHLVTSSPVARSLGLVVFPKTLALAWADLASGQPTLATATTPLPQSTSDWLLQTVPGSGVSTLDLLVVGGRLALLTSGTATRIVRAEARLPSGAADWQTFDVDAGGGIPRGVDLGGQLGVAYVSLGDLRFARTESAACW